MNKTRLISTKAIVTISALLSMGLVVFIALTANFYLRTMSRNSQELYKAYTAAEQLKVFRACIKEFDEKQRNYLLTGNARVLEQLRLKEKEAKTLLKSLEQYFPGHSQETAFETLKDLSYRLLLDTKAPMTAANTANLNLAIAGQTDEILEAIDELNNGLSQSTQQLIQLNVEYLETSKKWSLLEIALGVLIAIAGVVILFRDINLRNQLEAELMKAKKQAENNALLKDQFTANVSHEIRTPMNAILGFSDLLKKTNLSAEQENYLTAISASSSNLLNLINDILDFSKIEAGKLNIEKIPFSLKEVMKTLELMFTQKAAEKKLAFGLTTDKAVPPLLYGDPARLTQILVNLANNAIKFTERGSVEIRCELKSIELGVAQLVFAVKDTGIGIPPEKQEEIFERFNQGNSETTRRYGGTGLGLAIVKNLVELQNGTLKIKSKEGAGTEFFVTLSYPVSFEESQVPGKSAVAFAAVMNSRSRILLAEDNALNRQLAQHYLHGFGLSNVDMALNGEEAIHLLKSNNYDLILMDIQMPVMDGYQATRIIREELGLPLPIIAMTAHVIEGEMEKCLNYGMNDYISKPFREMQLYEIIKKHLPAPSGPLATSRTTPRLILPRFKTQMVNLDEFYSLSGANPEFIKEMIDVFIQQNPEDLSDLEKYIENQDYANIRHQAHRMKSSIGFMAIFPLIEPLNTIELLAEKKQNINEIKNNLIWIKPSCETAITELKRILQELKTETK